MADVSLPPPPPIDHTAVYSAVASTDDTLSSLSNVEFWTRFEVMKRRSQRVKRLSKMYGSHYWASMEELREKHKEYYWVYGKSPFRADGGNNYKKNDSNGKDEEKGNCTNWREANGEDDMAGGVGSLLKNKCGLAGCKAKPMALTRFCHPHILSDSKQKLYKGCSYVIKSAQTGPILRGKPILKSTVPSLCPMHFQKAEKHVARALKKAGLNVTSSRKVAPKLHVVVAEYVRQIQSKRRAAQEVAVAKIEIKEENIS